MDNFYRLYIKYYTFFLKENIILFGDGLFIKNIDKINPDKLKEIL